MAQQVLVVFIQHHLRAIISGGLISEAEDPDIIDCVLLSQNAPSAGAGPPQAGCVSRASRGPAGVFSCLSTAADCSAQAVPVVCAQVFEELDGKCCEEAVAVDLRRADCCSPASQLCRFFISVWSNIFHSWGGSLPCDISSMEWTVHSVGWDGVFLVLLHG